MEMNGIKSAEEVSRIEVKLEWIGGEDSEWRGDICWWMNEETLVEDSSDLYLEEKNEDDQK